MSDFRIIKKRYVILDEYSPKEYFVYYVQKKYLGFFWWYLQYDNYANSLCSFNSRKAAEQYIKKLKELKI
ncbi:MAG: hypothetical protein KDH96_10900 [Candidatus Riesia sp.]|nr:hypothetical protein [Candidatus Riesia sp.]